MVHTWTRQPHQLSAIDAEAEEVHPAPEHVEVHFKGGPLDGQSRWVAVVTAKYVVITTQLIVEECHDLATNDSWEVQRDEVSSRVTFTYYLRGEHLRGNQGVRYTYHLSSEAVEI